MSDETLIVGVVEARGLQVRIGGIFCPVAQQNLPEVRSFALGGVIGVRCVHNKAGECGETRRWCRAATEVTVNGRIVGVVVTKL